MATKASPGAYDCYANAEPDEPMFVLLARDRHAPALVALWAVLRELEQDDPAQVTEARLAALAMMEWVKARGKKYVGFGQTTLVGIFELIRQANAAIRALDTLNTPTTEEYLRQLLSQTEVEPSSGQESASP